MSLSFKKHLYTILTILGVAAFLVLVYYFPLILAAIVILGGTAAIYGMIYSLWDTLDYYKSRSDDTIDHGW